MTIELALLKHILYFSGLSLDELEAVKEFIVLEKTAEKGEIFLFEGVWSDFLYFLISGMVKVYKTSAEGKEQILPISQNQAYKRWMELQDLSLKPSFIKQGYFDQFDYMLSTVFIFPTS